MKNDGGVPQNAHYPACPLLVSNLGMTRRYRRPILMAVPAISVLICLLVVVVREQQYVLRFRAEQLLKDVQRLQNGTTTFEETERILDSWNPRYDHAKTWCRAAKCAVQVKIGDFANNHEVFFAKYGLVRRIYSLMGGRLAMAGADVTVEKGTIVNHEYGVMVFVFPSEISGPDAYGYTLIGQLEFGESTPFGPREDTLHPTYNIGWPSGCEICIAIHVNLKPGASAADVERLSQVNFSCLTRWLQPCRDKSDILPAAWAQAQKDLPSN